MRVLAITNLYPRPGYETLAPFNRQQFAALAAEHPLAIVAPVPWTDELRGRLSGRPAPPRRRHSGDVTILHPRFYFPPRVLRRYYGHCYLASIASDARRMIREFRPDVVLSSWAHPDGWAAGRLAREARLPCVIKVVGSDILVAGRDRNRRPAITEALQSADAVVAVSNHLAAEVVKLGVAPERVLVVHEGIDRALFRPGDRLSARTRLGLSTDDPIILFVGNLLRTKGAGVLLEAVALLRQRGMMVRCALVGRGPDDRWLRTLTGRLGIEPPTVQFIGKVDQDQLPDWYQACDVTALPSFSEGIPNVLREATACGRPFVATRVGGIPEIASGPWCRLVPPGSPEAVASALEDLLSTGGPTAAEVASIASSSGSQSWEESARQLANVLRSAIETHALAEPGGGMREIADSNHIDTRLLQKQFK